MFTLHCDQEYSKNKLLLSCIVRIPENFPLRVVIECNAMYRSEGWRQIFD